MPDAALSRKREFKSRTINWLPIFPQLRVKAPDFLHNLALRFKLSRLAAASCERALSHLEKIGAFGVAGSSARKQKRGGTKLTLYSVS
jgi:hypothetical protein